MRLNNFFKSLFGKKEKPLEPTVEVKNEVIEITSKTVSSQNDSVEVKKERVKSVTKPISSQNDSVEVKKDVAISKKPSMTNVG